MRKLLHIRVNLVVIHSASYIIKTLKPSSGKSLVYDVLANSLAKVLYRLFPVPYVHHMTRPRLVHRITQYDYNLNVPATLPVNRLDIPYRPLMEIQISRTRLAYQLPPMGVLEISGILFNGKRHGVLRQPEGDFGLRRAAVSKKIKLLSPRHENLRMLF